nr:cleavage stimulating factor 64 [Ipomoea batatas]
MDHGQNMDTVLALPANPKANSFIKRPDTQSSTHVAAWLLLPLPSSVTQDQSNVGGEHRWKVEEGAVRHHVMKKLMEQNEEQARQILIENPTLARDLFHAQIMLGMVQPSTSHVHQSAPAGPNEKAAPTSEKKA